MRKCKYPILFFAVAFSIAACETVINPTLEKADPILVVDGWITNKEGDQAIILTQTQNYFDSSTPPPVSGAVVKVTGSKGGSSNEYTFAESASKPGYYIWTNDKSKAKSIGDVGTTYKLSIVLANGETYTSESRMGPTVEKIDKITFEKNEPTQQNPDFYRGQFYAKDLIGKGDTYWIRAYKNGVLLNKPREINIAYDAGFDAGGDFSSDPKKLFDFIPPIRGRISPEDTDENDEPLSPFVPGDSVYVEVHSITLAAFQYLTQVRDQTNRPGGFSELFARPIDNVTTNIVSANGKRVVGFFNVAAVVGLGKRFKLD